MLARLYLMPRLSQAVQECFNSRGTMSSEKVHHFELGAARIHWRAGPCDEVESGVAASLWLCRISHDYIRDSLEWS